MEPQPNKPVVEDDETFERVTFEDIAASLRETGSKLRRAVLYPLVNMVKTYVDGTTNAVDGLADGLQNNKKPVEAKPAEVQTEAAVQENSVKSS